MSGMCRPINRGPTPELEGEGAAGANPDGRTVATAGSSAVTAGFQLILPGPEQITDLGQQSLIRGRRGLGLRAGPGQAPDDHEDDEGDHDERDKCIDDVTDRESTRVPIGEGIGPGVRIGIHAEDATNDRQNESDNRIDHRLERQRQHQTDGDGNDVELLKELSEFSKHDVNSLLGSHGARDPSIGER